MGSDGQRRSTESELLLRLKPISISEISPAKEGLDACCIRTVISLVWPYSASTNSLSFLLSDRDFRLRGANGSVKAIFRGPAAERVAETRAGIGDEVVLSLQGSVLVGNDDTTGSPRQRVAWEVQFESRVFLEVNQHLKLDGTIKNAAAK